jgi:hypothetical protein
MRPAPKILRWTLAAACFCLLACRPRLAPHLVAQHPKLLVQAPGQQRLEASAPQAPLWLRETPPAREGALPFIGRAAAPGRTEARAAAGRDLLEAVSQYVGVAVASRFEVVDTEATAGGKTSGASRAHGEVQTSAANALARLQPEAEYWERLGPAHGPPAGETHRYALLAWVPRAAIEQARGERAAKGRKAGAALLLAPVAQGSGCTVAGLLDADLALRLRGSGFFVSAPSPASGAASALPVVRAACSGAGTALQVDWSVTFAGRPEVRATLSRPAEELFALEADLAAALAAALATAGSPR